MYSKKKKELFDMNELSKKYLYAVQHEKAQNLVPKIRVGDDFQAVVSDVSNVLPRPPRSLRSQLFSTDATSSLKEAAGGLPKYWNSLIANVFVIAIYKVCVRDFLRN